MTLLEILRQELPKRGGWPKGVHEISTHASGRVFFDGRFAPQGFTLPKASDAWNKHEHPYTYTNAVTREQYEAALAASKEPLTGTCAYRWIEWGGGECPVNPSEMVDVIFGRGGRISTNIADCWRWNHNGTDSDIIAYRLHKPQEAEQAKADDEVDLNERIGQDSAPVWDGEGLPPVGVECEFISNGTTWGTVVIIGYDCGKVVFKPSGTTYYGIEPSIRQVFRPLRTEAERAIDEMVQLSGVSTGAAKILYDAGYRK